MAIERPVIEYLKKNIGEAATDREAIVNAYNADLTIRKKIKEIERQIFEDMNNDFKNKGYDLNSKGLMDLLKVKEDRAEKPETLTIREKEINEEQNIL